MAVKAAKFIVLKVYFVKDFSDSGFSIFPHSDNPPKSLESDSIGEFAFVTETP